MRIGYQLLFQNGHQGMSDGEMTMKELRLGRARRAARLRHHLVRRAPLRRLLDVP